MYTICRKEKKVDSEYKFFPTVAFLICKAYPEKFKPFQFRHAKASKFFKGRYGKKNILNAIKWIIKNKLCYDEDNIEIIIDSRYFLRDSDLEFYGVGYHQYKEYYKKKEDLIRDILKTYKIKDTDSNISTKRLREILKNAGRRVDKCEVEGCKFKYKKYKPPIHHIIHKSEKPNLKINLDSPENLIPLCRYHHGIADSFDWRELELNQPNTWIPLLLKYINQMI